MCRMGYWLDYYLCSQQLLMVLLKNSRFRIFRKFFTKALCGVCFKSNCQHTFFNFTYSGFQHGLLPDGMLFSLVFDERKIFQMYYDRIYFKHFSQNIFKLYLTRFSLLRKLVPCHNSYLSQISLI